MTDLALAPYLEQVSTWLGLKPTEVIAAVEFEQKMAA